MKNAELILEIAIQIQEKLNSIHHSVLVVTEIEHVKSIEELEDLAKSLTKVLNLVVVTKTSGDKFFLVTYPMQNISQDFVDLMKLRLNQNSHKGLWKVYAKANNIDHHVERMQLKLEKIKNSTFEEVDNQLADLANIAMFAFLYGDTND